MQMLWPRSLYGQILLAVALALFVAQAINATLLFSALRSRAVFEAATAVAARVTNYSERQAESTPSDRSNRMQTKPKRIPAISVIPTSGAMLFLGYEQHPELATRAKGFFDQSGLGLRNAQFSVGPFSALPSALQDGPMRRPSVMRMRKEGQNLPSEALLLSVQTSDGKWLNAATLIRPRDRGSVFALLIQTLLLYIAVLVPLALIARRIAKPLERLTAQVEQVGIGGGATPLISEGPYDVRQLIDAFNIMQARVAALLNEKDVMLGAIGHDLKTPLSSLRVRIESVEDDHERDKMSATIDEMVTILDDILMLARLGKIGEEAQRTDIGALTEAVLQEFSDTGSTVLFIEPDKRVVATVRPVLIRRALRNIIGNSVHYGGSATVRLSPFSIIIEDNGPGLDPDMIEKMFEPFMRAETSRNRETGGTGLGLTIARAILRSHGGDVKLENRAEGGLRVTMTLPPDYYATPLP
jgi:signal transduction histidine kinase